MHKLVSDQPTSLPRRDLLKNSVVLGSAALVANNLSIPIAKAQNQTTPPSLQEEKLVWSACTVNCHSRCPLRMHVKDGVITYVETDNLGEDIYGDFHQVRACARGRSMRRRVYNPDRLKYPMKRIGKRGEGKFKRISWEEAFEEIANNLKRIIKEHGNESLYLPFATGTIGATVAASYPPPRSIASRFMNSIGGCLGHHGTYSYSQIFEAMPFMYGSNAANSPTDIENSKLVVYFGNNPAETRMSGGGVTYLAQQAMERSQAKMIMIDPRYNDTAGGREDEWVPIRPGTDAAFVEGMAYVMITENLVDQAFLDTYCVGYDEKTLPASAKPNAHYKAYILGDGEDGIAKTPEWAEKITSIPKATIVRLAREIATTKPAYICQGWGPQRHANGEQTSRAIAMLACLTGNVGISGGNSGSREGFYTIPFVRLPAMDNPIKAKIPIFMWTDAVTRGTEMTALKDGLKGAEKLNKNIKFILNYAGNCIINQHSDINRTLDILSDESQLEMLVVIDNHMTSTAKCADILLPDCTTSEQMDFCMDGSAGNMGYVIFADKAIEPQFECKPIYEILSGIAEKMGAKEIFTEGRTQEEWLRHLYQQTQSKNPFFQDISFEEFRERGIIKQKDPNGHMVAFKKFREDPIANPLTTPSGKIEVYSERLAKIAETWELQEGDIISPLPIYAPAVEGWDDPKRAQYPLQLVGFHYKSRVHSTYGNVDVLDQASLQSVWINPIDAAQRGIKHNQMVRIFNDRGETRVMANVTPRILPGVVAMGEGAWYKPDGQKVDHNGSFNVLTTQRPSPLSKGNPQHTNLVQIAAVGGA
ncbi:DmsA/YnfE/YnfF family dimethyl sulfoxide reductase [Conservatibacter flavescens]|uniref:Dimethyl sulfoxide reductase subunit A n=1 Tax=Conservatibacter flavescens TaxID=28161 RepID=A0A2M8RZU6_9PAST|nr:DmsA/YnfE/YnfF family dimethyl sulfoxide reductase [Conservatibacter flavescens]PJG84386.1 dimethyl sulfoxide reductase subunit A [Conservatibacter flavescens]